MSYIGKRFNTGNSTVAQLHAGSTLRVAEKGVLEVTFAASAPKKPVVEGTRFITKYGTTGTILRMTDTKGMSTQVPPPGYEFYIADGTTVVRLVKTSDVNPL